VAANAQNLQVLGLTGSFGSGCTYIANEILQSNGFKKVSLSEILREEFRKQKGDPDGRPRRELQEFGDQLRSERGAGWLADEALKTIVAGKSGGKWIVDSIKNPAEIRALRNRSRNFFLLGIYASLDTRWARSSIAYGDNHATFVEDDQRDTGRDSPEHGQRVADCFHEADIVVSNESQVAAVGNQQFEKLSGVVTRYADLTTTPGSNHQPITPDECHMAIAYAAGQRSSCMQRKVGAAVVDDLGNVVSTGFNEVPMYERPCRDEFTECYRKRLRKQLVARVTEVVPEATEKAEQLTALLRKELRMLDYCRALHAEENAVLNLARGSRSTPADKCILYTTTYPCRLCANKIVSVGIRRVVYLEPYPDEQAKAILENAGVTCDCFQGVTYKAYFRLYGKEQ
jgi:deoxycytidylate deaminase